MRERAFVGPLEFDIAYERDFEDMCFSDDFLACNGLPPTVIYNVEVRSGGDIGVGCSRDEEKVAETGEFLEYVCGDSIIRYLFGYIRRERRCYARIELRGDMIKVNFDTTHDWPAGKIRVIWQFLMLEKLLARENAIILHSASVVSGGKAILFSAPSGTGKSTQADFWKKSVPGAVGFNGDRNLLMKQNGVWYMCGLPWHGTSDDCQNGLVPVAGIALLTRASQDRVSELSRMEKFVRIFGETTRNDWDKEFTHRVIDAVDSLTEDVPICELFCTKSDGGVYCLRNWLGM